MMKSFEELCRMSQAELKAYLNEYMKTKYETVISSDGFVYAKGSFPVMLVAHLDTVHKEPVKEIMYADNGNKISSPQGIGADDRCGVYMILKIIENYHCSVLFAEDEEIGCKGAIKFVDAIDFGVIDTSGINYIIELDRKGDKDAVFYECDSPEFEDFILKDKDWTLAFGTYTDIVEVAPAVGVAAVNFSCGYYNAHTTAEYLVVSEMEENIKKVNKLLARTTEDDYFEFIAAKYDWYKSLNYYGSSAKSSSDYSWYDNDYCCKSYYFFANHKGKMVEDEVYAANDQEAVGLFLMEHPEVCFNDIYDFLSEE